jgi:hypothetical protein
MHVPLECAACVQATTNGKVRMQLMLKKSSFLADVEWLLCMRYFTPFCMTVYAYEMAGMQCLC